MSFLLFAYLLCLSENIGGWPNIGLLIYFAYLKILVDGPNISGWPKCPLEVSTKSSDHREVREQPLLVDIGSCGLHTIHGAFKAGVQSTNWMLKEVLISAYHILHDSPAQRDDYQTVAESSVLLKF